MNIVEVIGCSGSGKSSLVAEVLRQSRRRGLSIATVPEVLLPAIPDRWARQPTVQNVLLDIAGLSQRLRGRGSHRALLAFARTTIRRETDRLLTGLNAYRSVLRTIAMHESLAARVGGPRAVLVDEGAVQSAHNVLAHVRAPCRAEDIAAFGRLVPVPDLIVFVTAPLDVALARTYARRDPPLKLRSPHSNARFVRHGHAMFDQLMTEARLACATQRIACEHNGRDQPYDAVAANVVEWIRGRFAL